MAKTPTTVNYAFTLPGGDPVTGGKVTFTLSGFDLDGGVVMPGSVEGVISVLGTGSVNLWPNVAGLKTTNYKVVVTPTVGTRADIGNITVPESATAVDLDDLVQVGTIAGLKTVVTTQAEYAALPSKDAQTIYLIRAEA